LNQGYTDVVIRGDIQGGRSFAAFYLQDNRVLAVDAINRPQEIMLGKRFITEKKVVDAAQLSDESKPLKDLLA
jgi:3-phenylpropionate/trans-cinnamate dioxygenase ferredoxin reductase subunit